MKPVDTENVRAREAGFRRLLGAGKPIHVEDSRYLLARLDDCRSALPALAKRVLALEEALRVILHLPHGERVESVCAICTTANAALGAELESL